MVTRKPKVLADKNIPMKHKHCVWDIRKIAKNGNQL